MQNRIRFFFILSCLISIVFVTSAQEPLSQFFIAQDGGIGIRHPASWAATEVTTPFKAVVATNNVLTIEFFDQALSEATLQIRGFDQLEAGLATFMGILQMPAPTETTIGLDGKILIGAFVPNGTQASYVLLVQSDTLVAPGYVFVRVTGTPVDLLTGVNQFIPIVSSLGPLQEASTGSASTPQQTTTQNNATAPDKADQTGGGAITPVQITPCTVSVSREGVASIHVGPGNNRSQIRFLEPNISVEVVGTANATDNTKWWRVNKEQVLPARQVTQVNETWIAEAEVDEAGDCDQIGTVAPPPIIPIRPTAAPTTAGATPQPTPSDPQAVFVTFTADRTTISVGDCVTLSWDARNVRGLYYEGRGVAGPSSATECPSVTTTYELRAELRDGSNEFYRITIVVDASCSFDTLPSYNTSSLAPNGDFEIWLFNIPPCSSPTIVISMYNINPTTSNLDPIIEVYVNGSFVGTDDDGAGFPNSQFVYTHSDPTSSYILEVIARSFNSSGGDYDLYVERR